MDRKNDGLRLMDGAGYKKIIIACDSYKGCLSSREVNEAIASGVKEWNAEDASSESSADSAEYQTVWRLADEPDAALDETKVQSILSALSSYVSAQVTNADPSAYGFDAPLATVQAKTASGTVTLRYASNADGCWLMTEGDSSVYAVDLSTVQALLTTADQLKTE